MVITAGILASAVAAFTARTHSVISSIGMMGCAPLRPPSPSVMPTQPAAIAALTAYLISSSDRPPAPSRSALTGVSKPLVIRAATLSRSSVATRSFAV